MSQTENRRGRLSETILSTEECNSPLIQSYQRSTPARPQWLGLLIASEVQRIETLPPLHMQADHLERFQACRGVTQNVCGMVGEVASLSAAK